MTLIRSFALLPAVFASAAFAQTAPPPSITGHALAQVTAPLQIQCSGLKFSSLVPQHVATYVTLPANGGPMVDPANIALPGSSQSAQASTCTASGDVGSAYHVMLPSSATITNGGGQTMTLNMFTVSSDGYSDPLNRFLRNNGLGLGTDSFGVGARLNIRADQAPGLYSGTYVVTVQYN
jgi:hypothetical protein